MAANPAELFERWPIKRRTDHHPTWLLRRTRGQDEGFAVMANVAIGYRLKRGVAGTPFAEGPLLPPSQGEVTTNHRI